MSKQFTKVLALGLAAMMVLGGCGGASTETKAPEEASAEKPQQQQEQSEPEAKRELTEVVIPKIASSESIIVFLKSHILTPWQPLTVSIHWHRAWSMNWA